MTSITDAGVSLRPDPDQVRAMLTAITDPGVPFEIRALKLRRTAAGSLEDDPFTKAKSGYFTDVETAVEHVARFTGNHCAGIHVTVNPLANHVQSWGLNRIAKSKASGDNDVVGYRHLYIDLDPRRPADTNATQNEHAASRKRAQQVWDYLRDRGWPLPVWSGSSGSGSLMLFRIELEVKDAPLVGRVLQGLSDLFSDDAVEIDTSTGNPGRLVRLAGTVNAKAITPTQDRPWRLATGKAPSRAGVVTLAQLEAVAEEEPEVIRGMQISSTGSRYDLAAILADTGIGYREKQQTYGTVYEIYQCLTSPDHPDGACFIQFPNGAVTYACLHNRCRGKGWHDVKPLLRLPGHPYALSWSTEEQTPVQAQVVLPHIDADSDWQEPIPFDDPTGPPFPFDALLPQLRHYVSAVADDTGVPVDLAAWCALATIGAATRGRYVVSPKPTWREPVHIQSLQVVASGGGKSPAYKLITEPLMRWDAQQAEDARQRLTSWKVKEKRLLAAERQAQKEADKQGVGTDAQLALEAVQLDIVKHAGARPIPQHIIVNDITPQAIWKFLYRQHGSGAAIHAEGGFLRNISRYSDLPIFDPILEGFSGDPHDLRRAGDEDDEGKVIPRPIFAISLAVQPQVLEDMGRLRGFRELGVSARLLTTFPRPVPSRSDLSDSVPETLQHWWMESILEIADRTDATTYSPGTLELSSEARAAFADEYAWYARAEADGVFQDMEEWGRKYRGQVLRIAGTLHVLEAPEPLKASISGENMRRAISIMRHAIEHARIGHGIMLGLGTQSSERFVLGVIDALLDTGHSQPVTSAQIYDRVRGRYAFRKSDRVLSVLRTLEEHRFVRLIPREGPGPKSYTVLRNPLRSGCENAEMASDSPGGDLSAHQDRPISHLRTHPKEQGCPPLLTMEPTELLEPTGTEGSGARPGEILL